MVYTPGNWRGGEPGCSCCKENYKADQELIRLRVAAGRAWNAMVWFRDSRDEEPFQDAIDELGVALTIEED